MNLASRCREAISHVAMLKKELAMQQKRTAAALASQREQNQRMADSLSNSMELSRLSRASSSEEASVVKDDNLARLVTATPSPLRATSRGSLSPASSKSTISSRPPSPPEETRDSPPVDTVSSALVSKGSSLDEDDTIVDTIPQVSPVSNSPSESDKETAKGTPLSKEVPRPSVYTTPKRGDKWAPNLQGPSAKMRGGDDEGGLFPHSASPQLFAVKHKSYNEEFPSDISNGKEDGSGAFPSVASQQRKMNLLNSIDAFEQSFSVDFPDSFTPKEDNQGPGVQKNSKLDIYNPFFSTPERSVGRSRRNADPFGDEDEEEKKTNEPSDYRSSNYETPPRIPRVKVASAGEPPRPEKSGSSAARERYEKALQPRQGAPISDKSSNPSALLGRNQNNRSNNQAAESGETLNVAKDRGTSKTSVVDIVDAFEGCIDSTQDSSDKSSSRLSLRRNVKQPISYAEPALNTKLRQGDTFFPKTEEEGQRTYVVPRTVSP